jgi:hypothetical protein
MLRSLVVEALWHVRSRDRGVCIGTGNEYNCRMSSIDTGPAVLTAHPSTPNDAVRSLGVQLRSGRTRHSRVSYLLDADMSRVRVPLSGAGGRADALWKHTCFEAFVAAADAPGYHEFNFSPSLDWAIYRFSAYREGMSPAEMVKLRKSPCVAATMGSSSSRRCA